MMTVPDRVQRLQLEPVAALRHGDVHEPQKFNYFADLPPAGIGVHPPPAGFVPPPMQAPVPVHPIPLNSARSPRVVPKLVPPSPASPTEGSPLADEFSSLSLKRVSKALKLISPTTNAPIKPSEDSLASCSTSGSDRISSTQTVSSSSSPETSKSVVNLSKRNNCPVKGDTVELPTGSRLRRWICPDPESPSQADNISSSASVASDATLEKSVSSERKETALDSDTCASDDSSSLGADVHQKTKLELASIKDECCAGGIPKGSKLWIWMGKEGN